MLPAVAAHDPYEQLTSRPFPGHMSQDSLENGFVAVGDIMLGDSAACVGFGFHSRYPRDAAPAFAQVTSLLRRGEIVLGNLEGPLAAAPTQSTRYRADQMRGDPEYAAALRSAGFTAIAIANNHAMQHGLAAFDSTVSCLRTAGILCVGLRGIDGWCSAPVVQVTRSGLRIGLLGYCWRPRQYETGEPPYAEGEIEAVIRDTKELGRSSDAVVVSLHWGEEFVPVPSLAEIAAAHRIIDAGASVIVGHHPHVVRPVERYRAGVICYSLGNFATDMLWQTELRTGAILECELAPGTASNVQVSSTRVDESYRPVPVTARVGIETTEVAGMAEADYRSAVARSVRGQRLASYRYAAVNITQYPRRVLGELVATTLMNKVVGFFGPLMGRAGSARSAPVAKETAGDDALSILHVVAPAEFGGLESVLRALAVGQASRGHSVRVAAVLSARGKPHGYVTTLQADGVDTIPLYIADRDYLAERRAVRQLCREFRPDVLHTHGFRSDVVAGAVARAERIRVVSTCHGFIESSLRARLYQKLQRRMLRRFDAVVAVSRPIFSKLREAGVPPSVIHLVPNGFTRQSTPLSRDAARRFLGCEDGFLVGWVGRLSPEKGADLALEAFARLENPRARLVLIGEGRDASSLDALAVALGISDRILRFGVLQDAGRYFAAFDVFLLSSRTEGTPMVLLEAMAASVPIVATRVGGVPDVIDESGALLVNTEDPVAIAVALADVLADPGTAAVRATRALAILTDRFGSETWLDRYEAVYEAAKRPR